MAIIASFASRVSLSLHPPATPDRTSQASPPHNAPQTPPRSFLSARKYHLVATAKANDDGDGGGDDGRRTTNERRTASPTNERTNERSTACLRDFGSFHQQYPFGDDFRCISCTSLNPFMRLRLPLFTPFSATVYLPYSTLFPRTRHATPHNCSIHPLNTVGG